MILLEKIYLTVVIIGSTRRADGLAPGTQRTTTSPSRRSRSTHCSRGPPQLRSLQALRLLLSRRWEASLTPSARRGTMEHVIAPRCTSSSLRSDDAAYTCLSLLLEGEVHTWWQSIKTQVTTWQGAKGATCNAVASRCSHHEIYSEIFYGCPDKAPLAIVRRSPTRLFTPHKRANRLRSPQPQSLGTWPLRRWTRQMKNRARSLGKARRLVSPAAPFLENQGNPGVASAISDKGRLTRKQPRR